ncbi:MAG: YeiH family protein [Rectinemataceae bacterium]|nr:YeiH family protein [Rectinemataceae bacterium]
MRFIQEKGKGILVCLLIAAPSWFLGKTLPIVGGPVFGIVIGMIAAALWKDKSGYHSGIAFTSKKILQYAVILLGFGMNLSSIAKTGLQSLPIILSTIATSLIVAYILYRTMKLPSNIAVLVGVGSSICGGSAIAATAPIIEADDAEIATSISVIFLFNVAAALIFPTLGGLIGLSDAGFGLFAGTAVNDTSSVTAAATAWDGIHLSNTLETATIVKLTRTLAIIPITLGLAAYRSRKKLAAPGHSFSIKKSLPTFILWFIAAAIATTVLGLPADLTAFLKNLSKFFIIMAMSAIGLNTDIAKLVKSGGKPILIGFCCWVSIAAVSLGMQKILGIW